MSVRVDLADLPGLLTDLGRAAFVCTVGAEGAPKVVHSFVAVAGDELEATVGPGSAANVEAGSPVTLVFAGGDDERALLVDATGSRSGHDTVRLVPTAAVWHRSAAEAGS